MDSKAFVLANSGVNIDALSTDAKFNTNIRTGVMPATSVYGDFYMAPGGSSQWVETLSENSTRYRPSDIKITFNINSREILNFKEATFNFAARCWASDGSQVGFSMNMASLISRIVVKVDSKVIMDQLNKNVFTMLNYVMARNQNYDATLGSQAGIGTIAERLRWANQAVPKNYAIPLNIPLFTAEEQIMGRLPNGYTVDLYLAQPAQCMFAIEGFTSQTATLFYELYNTRLRYKEKIYQFDVQDAALSLSVYPYAFTNYKLYTSSIGQNEINAQILIPCKQQGIRSFIVFMRESDSIDNPFSVDSLTQFKYADTNQYQLRVDNVYYPPQPISTGGDQGPHPGYIEAARVMDTFEFGDYRYHSRQNNGNTVLYQNGDFLVSIDDFTDNKFLACIDLLLRDENDPNYISKFDSTPGNVNLLFNINFSKRLPKRMSVFIAVVHTSIAIIRSNGSANLIE